MALRSAIVVEWKNTNNEFSCARRLTVAHSKLIVIVTIQYNTVWQPLMLFATWKTALNLRRSLHDVFVQLIIIEHFWRRNVRNCVGTYVLNYNELCVQPRP